MRKIKYVMLGVALSAQVIPLAYAMCGKEATSEKRSPEECSKDNDCFIKWAYLTAARVTPVTIYERDSYDPKDYTVGASPQDCADRYIKTKFYYCTGWINKTCDWSAPLAWRLSQPFFLRLATRFTWGLKPKTVNAHLSLRKTMIARAMLRV